MRLIDADDFFRQFPELDTEPYNNVSTIEERPKGKWIEIHKGYICSNCNKYTITINDKHYCFKCGADMRKEEQNANKT